MRQDYRLKKMATLIKEAEKVLDLGWADMPNPYLENKIVVGLDHRSPEKPSNYCEVVSGDVSKLPSPFENSSFDGLIAGEIIEHLEEPVSFLKGCHATLRQGGTLVLSTPNPNSPWEQLLTLTLSRQWMYAADHVCVYPQRWLIRMLERAGFKSITLYSGGIQLPFGLVPFPRPWCYQTIAVAMKP